ncbi:unnamed protein product [Rotaria socialis]|uniref:Tetraspanin n=2 Tax=Rotaria socialis TaxID=392032 RepID=A0A817VYZ1_9BILA|nr:unnamed protein product [Rotaria socialis]CAF3345649.1 unnamed protein product [Rotaria socialis]CAF3397437.1 unnamed protein product [Rotaria socialis]CAF4254119.1 unnamed protein product [Rotaria socialis]CAF4633654.1 unnamed protein product [Rotaria socialis]
MKSRPAIVATTSGTSTPAKRTLFRIALTVALVCITGVTTILILHGGLSLMRLRYFVDIGVHPRHVTSLALVIFGILALLTLMILIIGLIKVNRSLAIVAAVLLGVCSLGLIAFSTWSFLTIASGQLAASINSTIVKELDQTQYRVSTGNDVVIENTPKMARLEKQHQCCGLTDPIEDYRSRQPAIYGSLNPSSSSGNSHSKGRNPPTQRNTATFGSSVQLPISCCNEKYRSENNLCIDMFSNNTNPINRYNIVGCYAVVARHKFERIQREGFATVVAACLSVISCIALAAVVRLLGEGYQIVPFRTIK